MRNRIIIGVSVAVVVATSSAIGYELHQNRVAIYNRVAAQATAHAQAAKKAEDAKKAADAQKAAARAAKRATLPANAVAADQCAVTSPATKKTTYIQGDCSEAGF